MSRAMRARSICCWRWRGNRRSTWPTFPFWRWPISTCVFIEAALKICLELAADYLVMAAWLAFLKLRLLLPEPATADGPSAEEMATALARRLPRLRHSRSLEQADEPPRNCSATFFPWQSGSHRRNQASQIYRNPVRPPERLRRPAPQRVLATVHLAKRTVWSLSEARASLEGLAGMAEDWSRLDEYLINYVVDPSQKATVFASSFAAALEMVREGEVELHQKEAFAPLYFRKRSPQSVLDAMTAPDLPAK